MPKSKVRGGLPAGHPALDVSLGVPTIRRPLADRKAEDAMTAALRGLPAGGARPTFDTRGRIDETTPAIERDTKTTTRQDDEVYKQQ